MTRRRAYVMAGMTIAVLLVWLTKIDPPGSNASGPATPPLAELVAELRDGAMKVDAPCSYYGKSGTGFLVGPRLVATALHVVNGADTVSLLQDGHEIATGSVIGRDFAHDLALLVTDRPLPGHVFELSTEPAVPGETIAMLGFTGGQDSPRDAEGTVIGRHRLTVIAGLEQPDLVEFAMPVSHGDSGGPIFDARDGRVVAMVDAGVVDAGTVGLGIDAQIARPLIAQWAAAPQPIHGSSC